MSEKINLKERFGKLGMYLIDRAKEEIKDISQQKLFQKAEIKKKYRETTNQRADVIKNQFINDYVQKLNTSLSNTLLNSKEQFLNLKNELIKRLEEDLRETIKEKISQNYSDYIAFFTNLIKHKAKINNPNSKISLHLNAKDFEYFNTNINQLEPHFKNPIVLENIQNQIIGGFKIEVIDDKIFYDHSVDALIIQNREIIEKEFTGILMDYKIKEIERQYEDFIKDQKNKIDDYLIKYDRI
ncbi:MAG: hypothetical protein GF317_01615 [Candidatus Lokiarchaeota archaeon]|nr:hypothetical protein [Candidatus Lokiarchaeota archaeon]MBD3198642.1 hypothetical protein [Candidatus Lokiarchaeota archaeon]